MSGVVNHQVGQGFTPRGEPLAEFTEQGLCAPIMVTGAVPGRASYLIPASSPPARVTESGPAPDRNP